MDILSTKLKQLNFSKNSENSEKREILKTHASNVYIRKTNYPKVH